MPPWTKELEAIHAKLDRILALLEQTQEPVPQRQRVAVVSYFRGADQWAATLAAKPPFVIINPNSGPGPSPDSLYVAQIPRNTAAGVPTFAYTHTRYAARTVDEVMADIAKYRGQYTGLAGFFIDTVSTKPEHVAYYEDLCARIHSLGVKVCLNPGTKSPERYLQIADYVMVSETDAATYKGQVRPAHELKPEYAGKLWHAIHNCSLADMPAVVAKAKATGAGLIYVTDDVMANPWDKLPTYMDALVAEVAKP